MEVISISCSKQHKYAPRAGYLLKMSLLGPVASGLILPSQTMGCGSGGGALGALHPRCTPESAPPTGREEEMPWVLRDLTVSILSSSAAGASDS